MPDIFISYRREDGSGHAGRLFDCIRERFGDESVFMDVTDISPGEDFTVALDGALASCRVVLVVIGPQWLTSTSSDGRRRLDDPADHLRMEVAHALQRNARVIPVLVRGAAMAQERDLPADLQALARRQAHEVSDSRWSFDTNQLIRVIEQTLGSPPSHDARDAVKGVPYNRRNSGTVGDGLQAVPNVARDRATRLAAPAAIFVVLIALTAYLKWFGGGGPDIANDPSRGSGGGSGRSSTTAPLVRLPGGGEVRAAAATYKLLGGLVSRGDDGPQTLRLFLRTTNVDARYGLTVTHDSFRLLVDERAIAPDQGPIEAVPMQSAIEGWVTFQMPARATAVTLQVGHVGEATAKIPIDLRTAGKVAAEKKVAEWRSPIDMPFSLERQVGAVVFIVDGLRLEHYSDAVAPLQPEKLLLTIKVRLKNVGGQYGVVISGELFRLLVDDMPLAPTKTPIQALAYQSDLESEVGFVFPGTATKTVLQLGDLNDKPIRVPLDLSAARRQP